MAVNDNPWIKFYPGDWRNNLALQGCSLAARGLWVELLALMRGCPREGLLTTNCKPMTTARIAALVNAEEAEIVRLLAELEAAKVVKRIDGCIASTRMMRWAQKASDGEKSASKRWNATPNGSDPLGSLHGSDGSGSESFDSDSDSEGKKKGSAEGEKKPRKPATGPEAEITRAFEAAFFKARGVKYAFEGAKDGAAVSRLLKNADGNPQAVIARIPALFADDFYGPKATLAMFVNAWNKLTPASGPKPLSEADRQNELEGLEWARRFKKGPYAVPEQKVAPKASQAPHTPSLAEGWADVL